MNASLQQEKLESFTRCVNSMDHLARNIASISIEGHCTRGGSNGRFEHSVKVRIKVRESDFLENAISYIWESLGRYRWLGQK